MTGLLFTQFLCLLHRAVVTVQAARQRRAHEAADGGATAATVALRRWGGLVLPMLLMLMVLPGCATTTGPAATRGAMPPPAACADLAADLEQTEHARRTAQAEAVNSWKLLVVPAVAAGRYVAAQSTIAQADERIEVLRAELRRQECSATRVEARG